jgi:hypothetical protein
MPIVLPKDGSESVEDGMTLRDYFAAHAIAGIMARGCGDGSEMANAAHAAWSYAVANEMLLAREVIWLAQYTPTVFDDDPPRDEDE